MSLRIVFTEKAYETLAATLDFVAKKWNKKSSAKLKSDTIRKLQLVSDNPFMYKASRIDINLRKGIISKQTSFFYEVHSDHILVLYFWDNRQLPVIE